MTILTNSSETNRSQLRYIAETVFGTTPINGLTKNLRITLSNIVAKKSTKSSAEIVPTRMVPSIIETEAMSGGDIDGEFSAGGHDDFMEAFLLGTWSKPMNMYVKRGTSVSITSATQITLTGVDASAFFTVGQYIRLSGFATPANNSVFPVSAVAFAAGNTVITTTGALVVEAGSQATKLQDAGDVFSATTTTTVAAGNTLTTVAALPTNLQVGQKIHISGLGREVGTIQALATDPSEGDLVTIYDGAKSVAYEIRTVQALTTPGNVWVPLSGTPATMAASLAAAVMTSFNNADIQIYATVATDTVTFTNGRSVGGTLAASNVAAFTVTAFAGGVAAASGFFTIASIPSTTTLTTVETLPVDTNVGAHLVIVKGSHVRNPGNPSQIIKRSFTIQTGFVDVNTYFTMKGQRVGSMDFNIQAGDIVKVKYGFTGLDTRTGSLDLLGLAPYTALDSVGTEIFNATSNVGNIYVNGAPLATALQDITFKGDNKLRELKAVGSKYPVGVNYGHFMLSGAFKAYFNSLVVYNYFLNHSTVSLSFPFTDADSNVYWFTIPAIKLTSDPVSPTGQDQDVMDNVSWEAFRDSNLNTQMMIDRFSSVYPTSTP